MFRMALLSAVMCATVEYAQVAAEVESFTGDQTFEATSTSTVREIELHGCTATLTGASYSEPLGKADGSTVRTYGESQIVADSVDKTYYLPEIENHGTLTVKGVFSTSFARDSFVPEEYYKEQQLGKPLMVSVNGEVDKGYGFRFERAYRVVQNIDGGRLVIDKATDALVNDWSGDVRCFLAEDGYAYYSGGMSFTEYVINKDHVADMATITRMWNVGYGRSNLDDAVTDVLCITMTSGTFIADADVHGVNFTGGKLVMRGGSVGAEWKKNGDAKTSVISGVEVVSEGGTIEAVISDNAETGVASKVTAIGGTTTLSGANTYSGGTVIDGATLVLANDATLGKGKVEIQNLGVLDMGGNALSNDIVVTGCTLRGAGSYTGNLDVYSALALADSTSANKVTMYNQAELTGADLTANALDVRTAGDATVGGDLTINENGTITLNNGKKLTVGGGLTLGSGFTLKINGQYVKGDTLLSSTGTLAMTDAEVKAVYNNRGYAVVIVEGNSMKLVTFFDQELADMMAQANWAIATSSRAFVNTVRGQRTNPGCIANGRGTAWVSALGAYNDMTGGNISMKGAAVGADMMVGRSSNVGVAFGYTDAEVSPTSLGDVDQTGTYVALYGEHGLKKLSPTSSLGLDWVAAYGQTESKADGSKWNQDSLQLNTRLSWNKKVTESLSASVFGGVEYFATESDTVDGIKTGSVQNLRGEVGVGARYVAWGIPSMVDGKSGLALGRGCEKLVLHGELRYMNDMVRSNPVIRMNSLSGTGVNPGRQGMGVEAGATYRINECWSASANYGFNTMNDSKEHRVNVGASYTF